MATAEKDVWLKERSAGIGGSDAAAVLGISPWKSTLQLWAEKCGLVEQPNLDELEYIEWGQVLEEPIAKKYQQVTGRTLIDHGRFAIRTHPERTWQHCTIDREILPSDCPERAVPGKQFLTPLSKIPGDLSIKNVGAFKLAEWQEEPPLPYQVQLQHELAVTGLQWGSFAVLIGGQKFFWCDVPRNDRFISHLIEKEEEFWDMVMRGEQPKPDSSDSSKEVLLRLYPKDTGEAKALPMEYLDFIEERRVLREDIKKAETKLQEIDNLIKAAIGESSIGIFPDGSGFSWKHQHRDSYVAAASDYRVLREIKPKGRK